MSVQGAAIQVLKEAGKPLRATEIAKLILEAGLWKSDGKTPEATVSAQLYSDIKSNGDKSPFVKEYQRSWNDLGPEIPDRVGPCRNDEKILF